jgi:hypothetical protein
MEAMRYLVLLLLLIPACSGASATAPEAPATVQSPPESEIRASSVNGRWTVEFYHHGTLRAECRDMPVRIYASFQAVQWCWFAHWGGGGGVPDSLITPLVP